MFNPNATAPNDIDTSHLVPDQDQYQGTQQLPAFAPSRFADHDVCPAPQQQQLPPVFTLPPSVHNPLMPTYPSLQQRTSIALPAEIPDYFPNHDEATFFSRDDQLPGHPNDLTYPSPSQEPLALCPPQIPSQVAHSILNPCAPAFVPENQENTRSETVATSDINAQVTSLNDIDISVLLSDGCTERTTDMDPDMKVLYCRHLNQHQIKSKSSANVLLRQKENINLHYNKSIDRYPERQRILDSLTKFFKETDQYQLLRSDIKQKKRILITTQI